MSTNTKHLGLFEYEQGVDDALTFNLDNALNDNWDKLDSAVDELNGNFGKLDSAVDALRTEASGYGGQIAALGKKLVTINPPAQYDDCPTGKALIDLPNGFYRCIGGNYPWLPQGAQPWGTVRVWHYLDWVDADFRDVYGKSWMFTPAYSGSNPWREYAIVTAPQEFDLPLAAGVNGYARYNKSQAGLVVMCLTAVTFSPSITDNTIIATLPLGYRPKTDTYAPFVVFNIGGNANGYAWLEVNGNLHISTCANKTISQICGIISFYSAS